MPLDGGQPFTDTPDDTAQAAAALPFDQGLRTSEAFGHFDFSQTAGHVLSDVFSPHGPNATPLPGVAPYKAPLDTDTLNEKYGVPGVLRFNKPTQEGDAAFEQHMALQRQFRDTVFARTNPQPLTDFAAGLAGSLVDPAALSTMIATGGLGEAAMGAVGLKTAAEAAPAVTTLGKIANAARVPLEGALDNVPFVGINAGLNQVAGDDYDMGDALRDIAAGAILHTTAHLAFRAVPAMFRRGGQAMDADIPADANAAASPEPLRNALEPDPAPAAGVPPEVDALSEPARQGAFVKALDDLSADRPVDVAAAIQTELDARATEAEAARPPAADPYEWRDPAPPIENDPYAWRSPAATEPEPTNEAASILADTNRRFAAGDAGDLDQLRPPGQSDAVAGGGAPAAARVGGGEAGHVSQPGGGRVGGADRVAGRDDGPVSGDEPGGTGGVRGESAGGAAESDKGSGVSPPRLDARALIAADPELTRLAADTARFAAAHGLEPPAADPNAKPVLDAVHAAAQCLLAAPEEIF
jgi:hypothetical protein